MDKNQLILHAIHTRTDSCLVDDIDIIDNQLSTEGLLENPSLEDLDGYEEHIARAQWLAYTLDDGVLKELVNQVKVKGNDVLRASSSFHTSKEELVRFCKEELKETLSDAEIIKKITPYDDGAYTCMPGYLNMLSNIILMQGLVDLWLDLMDSLRYFPLQGALLYQLKTTEEYSNVFKHLGASEAFHRKKVVMYLLRDRLFETMVKEHDYLTQNSENDSLNEEVIQLAENELAKWEESAENVINESFDIMLAYFTMQEMCEWYVGKLAHANRKAERYAQMDFYALEKIEAYISARLDLRDIDFKTSSLEALTYYAKRVAAGAEIESDNITELLNCFSLHVYTEEAFTTPVLSDLALDNMRNVYNCIIKVGGDWLHISKEYEPCEVSDTQPYYEQLFRTQIGDSYWLAILLLMCETTEDFDYFRNVCVRMFEVFFPVQSLMDPLFLPAYLGDVLVVQMFKDYKNEYEMKLIECVKRISLLLRILSANDGEMSNEAVSTLINRKSEWDEERKQLNTYNKNLVDFLDGYMDKVMKKYGKQE